MLPTVAEWKLSSLPKYLNSDQVVRLIDSCSKKEPQGFRDRAIVLLLLRLALRAGDIVNMGLTDIDWLDGTLLVRGKGRRDVRLPLPQDAGNAVLDHVESAPTAQRSTLLPFNKSHSRGRRRVNNAERCC
jgi:site-specific recombinase XerC